MKKLSKFHYSLIEDAVKCEGSFDPKRIMFVFLEKLTPKEANVIEKFLTWVNEDTQNRTFGSGNYQSRFEQFLSSKKTTV